MAIPLFDPHLIYDLKGNLHEVVKENHYWSLARNETSPNYHTDNLDVFRTADIPPFFFDINFVVFMTFYYYLLLFLQNTLRGCIDTL